MKTYYEILGVRYGAEPAELQEARRTLARTHHPDLGGKGLTMAEINVAYDTLADQGLARKYRASLKSTHVDCSACNGAGGTWRQKGFRGRSWLGCSVCNQTGLLPKKGKR